jgi:predicted naringenin-chalcone synthase
MQHSFNILNNYGNMSSATILFVLDDAKHDVKGQTDIMICFGQGIHAVGLVLDRPVKV